MLQPGGTCVTFGVSEAAHTTFASRDFFATGGVRVYGLTLFHELMSVERAGIGLALLADLIAAKKLRPQIAVEAPWSEIGTVARRLIDREFEDQPEGPVRLSGGKFAAEHDPIAAPIRPRRRGIPPGAHGPRLAHQLPRRAGRRDVRPHPRRRRPAPCARATARPAVAHAMQ
jgi:hypothetical protein